METLYRKRNQLEAQLQESFNSSLGKSITIVDHQGLFYREWFESVGHVLAEPS